MDTPIIVKDGSLHLEIDMPRIDQFRKFSGFQIGHPSKGRMTSVKLTVNGADKPPIQLTPDVPTEVAIDYTGENRILVLSSDASGKGVTISGKEDFFDQIPAGTTNLTLDDTSGKTITGVTIDDVPIPDFPTSGPIAVTVLYRPDTVTQLEIEPQVDILKIVGISLLGLACLTGFWMFRKPPQRKLLSRVLGH